MRLEKLSNQLTLRLGGLRQLGWAPGKTEKEKKKRMLTHTHSILVTQSGSILKRVYDVFLLVSFCHS